MRVALSLLIFVLTLTASGISTSITSMVTGEDCCASEPAERHSDDGEHSPCPPRCHACQCSPIFAVPQAIVAPAVARASNSVVLELVLLPPVSPPGPDVFHPPRNVQISL